MGKINMGRVILGGLLAGLVINVGEFVLNGFILNKEWEEAMRSLNRQPIGGQAVAVFLTLGFLGGILMIWIYAAIRPRFGPGPKTALCAGLVVWTYVSLFATLGQLPTGVFPAKLLLISTAWQLVETPIAAIAGAWLYKEE